MVQMNKKIKNKTIRINKNKSKAKENQSLRPVCDDADINKR